MKKVICGLMCGLIIGGTSVAFAEQLNAETAGFQTFVNGKELKTENPVVVINGNAYAPIGDLSNLLGVKFRWNEEMNRMEIGEVAEASASEESYSRQNPAPLDVVQKVRVDTYLEKYDASVRVLDVKRGADAWADLAKENQFNDPAKEGYEYLLVKVAVSILGVDGEKAIRISGHNFEFYSSDNVKYGDFEFVVCPDPKLDTSAFAGGNAEGWIAKQVKKDDAYPKIGFGVKYDGSGGVWFRAYK